MGSNTDKVTKNLETLTNLEENVVFKKFSSSLKRKVVDTIVDNIQHGCSNPPKIRKLCDDILENLIWKWIDDWADKSSQQIKASELQEAAMTLAKSIGMGDFKGSNEWLDEFRIRHKIEKLSQLSDPSQFTRQLQDGNAVQQACRDNVEIPEIVNGRLTNPHQVMTEEAFNEMIYLLCDDIHTEEAYLVLMRKMQRKQPRINARGTKTQVIEAKEIVLNDKFEIIPNDPLRSSQPESIQSEFVRINEHKQQHKTVKQKKPKKKKAAIVGNNGHKQAFAVKENHMDSPALTAKAISANELERKLMELPCVESVYYNTSFIPNPTDMSFTTLLGLEAVVDKLLIFIKAPFDGEINKVEQPKSCHICASYTSSSWRALDDETRCLFSKNEPAKIEFVESIIDPIEPVELIEKVDKTDITIKPIEPQSEPPILDSEKDQIVENQNEISENHDKMDFNSEIKEDSVICTVCYSEAHRLKQKMDRTIVLAKLFTDSMAQEKQLEDHIKLNMNNPTDVQTIVNNIPPFLNHINPNSEEFKRQIVNMHNFANFDHMNQLAMAAAAMASSQYFENPSVANLNDPQMTELQRQFMLNSQSNQLSFK